MNTWRLRGCHQISSFSLPNFFAWSSQGPCFANKTKLCHQPQPGHWRGEWWQYEEGRGYDAYQMQTNHVSTVPRWDPSCLGILALRLHRVGQFLLFLWRSCLRVRLCSLTDGTLPHLFTGQTPTHSSRPSSNVIREGCGSWLISASPVPSPGPGTKNHPSTAVTSAAVLLLDHPLKGSILDPNWSNRFSFLELEAEPERESWISLYAVCGTYPLEC